jgi:hypothetical protein
VQTIPRIKKFPKEGHFLFIMQTKIDYHKNVDTKTNVDRKNQFKKNNNSVISSRMLSISNNMVFYNYAHAQSKHNDTMRMLSWRLYLIPVCSKYVYFFDALHQSTLRSYMR